MSLLTIVQGACADLNIVQPSAVAASSDLQVKQLLELAKKEGKELARRFDWQILQKETSFTTAATETQTTLSAVASDFARIVNRSMWNRTESRRILGPLNAQEWQHRKAAAAQAAVTYFFRIRGDSILFNPTPTAGQSVYFEYISTKWCQSSGGTAQTNWAADGDTALIDEDIIKLGIVWRWKMAKGLEYAEDFRTYEMALQDIFGADAGKDNIDLTGDASVAEVNISEGSWSL